MIGWSIGTDSINDAEPPEPAGCNRLERISFQGLFGSTATSKITDAGLEHLKGFAELRDLWLDATGVTDAGLERLSTDKLHILSLSRTTIKNAGSKAPNRFAASLLS